MGSSTKAALSLMVGRTIGFAVAFAIPLVLVRVLTQHEFGFYKYLFLLVGTLGVLQLGMAESLYYFIPRFPQSAGRAIANALLSLAAIACTTVAIFEAAAPLIARWSGNPGIAPYLPWLGVYLGLTLLSTPLEVVMVSRKAYRHAAVTYALADSARAAALVVPGMLAGSLRALLFGAIAYGVLRLAILAIYVLREYGRDLLPDRTLWRDQLAYALPFAAAVIVEAVQMNLHQYIVFARVDAATFAIYAAGCLQIPLVDLLTMSVANVMMVRMSEDLAAGQGVLADWHDAIARLAFVLFPLAAALALTARDVIVLLFTSTYASSVPVFRISIVAIVLAAVPVDAVLRVWAQTRFLIVMNLIRLAVVAVSIGWAIAEFALPGAMLATVAALFVARTVAVARIARLLNAGWRAVLPWRDLGVITAIALLSVPTAAWLHGRLALPPIGVGAATAGLYGATYLAITAASRASWRAELGRRLGWLVGSESR